MKNFTKFCILLIAITGVFACSSDDNSPTYTLPPATTTGANTAGCYINGKLLIPRDGAPDWTGTPYGLTTGAGINYHPPTIGNDYKYVRIVNYVDTPTYSVWIQIDNMSEGEGIYTIGQANGMYFMDGPENPFIIAMYYDGENISKTYYSYENSGVIEITRFDYYEGIYSGTFSGNLYNIDDANDSVHITNGRFDIRNSTLNNK